MFHLPLNSLFGTILSSQVTIQLEMKCVFPISETQVLDFENVKIKCMGFFLKFLLKVRIDKILNCASVVC